MVSVGGHCGGRGQGQLGAASLTCDGDEMSVWEAEAGCAGVAGGGAGVWRCGVGETGCWVEAGTRLVTLYAGIVRGSELTFYAPV